MRTSTYSLRMSVRSGKLSEYLILETNGQRIRSKIYNSNEFPDVSIHVDMKLLVFLTSMPKTKRMNLNSPFDAYEKKLTGHINRMQKNIQYSSSSDKFHSNLVCIHSAFYTLALVLHPPTSFFVKLLWRLLASIRTYFTINSQKTLFLWL